MCFFDLHIDILHTYACSGTALGDFTAESVKLGFGAGAGLYGGLMALTALLAYLTPISRVVLFWVWFVLTRPFGATFGDYLNKPKTHGGLGMGTKYASAIIAAPLIISFCYLMWEEHKKKKSQASRQANPVKGIAIPEVAAV